MTQAGDQREPGASILAMLWALTCLIAQMMCRGFVSKEVQHHVADLEACYAFNLFGGGLRDDPRFQALNPDQQHVVRRRILKRYFQLRRTREGLHLIATKTGTGYRRNSAETCARRFERRIAPRQRACLDAVRLPHVSATSEPLAGAPP